MNNLNNTKVLIGKCYHLFKRAVSLDLRSLALYRICLGLIVTVDIISRITEFSFYTDSGPVPSWLLLRTGRTTSVYFISNEEVFTLFWMLCTIGAALLLIVGWKTQLQIVLVYVFVSALHTRNEFILDGGDRYLRCILFFSCFLPLGALYSFDYALALRSGSDDNHAHPISQPLTFDYTSWGTCLFLSQIFWLYFTSGLVKTGEAWRSGQALALVLHCEGFISSFALRIRDLLPSLLTTFLTHVTIWIETLSGWFLFFKPLSEWLPLVGVISLAAMHFGFILFMELGLFPYMCIVVLLAPLPSMVWRVASRVITHRLRASERLRLVYVELNRPFESQRDKYSSTLSRGEWTVRLIHTFLLPLTPWHIHSSDLTISSSQFSSSLSSHDVILSIRDEETSWYVVDEKGNVWTGYQAWQCVLTHSIFFFWLAPCVRILSSCSCFLAMWRFITRLHCLIQRFKKKRFRISSSSNYKTIVWYPSRLLTVILIGLTVYLTWWCVDNLQWLPMPNTFKQIAYTFKIDQYWRLFSPDPCTTPLWVVMPATLANGTTLDFYKVYYHPNPSNFAFEWTKPPLISWTYRSYRWKRYFDHITATHNPVYVQYFLHWTCQRWNSSPDRQPSERVHSIELSFLEESNERVYKSISFQRNCNSSF